MPRERMVMFKEAHGAKLKNKKGKLQFTSGTSPFEREVMNFVIG